MNERVAKVIAKCEQFIATTDDDLSLPRESAELVHTLALAAGAKSAVEIGTSYGYSGLWIGAAMQHNGGRLVTIEKEQRKQDIAGAYFADAGLAGIVARRTGLALDVLRHFDGPVDFILNDADKENCQTYVELLLPRLSDRAVIITDNTTSHAAKLADFCAWIRGHSAFASVHLPVGSGMEFSVKL